MVKRDPPRGHCWAGGAVCGDSDSRLWARKLPQTARLLEKGSVLIRALESGSRVGMGMRMHHAQQQALLEEMAGQPGVRGSQSPMSRASLSCIATPIWSGKRFIRRMKCSSYSRERKKRWRRIGADGEPVLEVYRQFQPMFAPWLECTICAHMAKLCHDTTSYFHCF